MFVKKTPQNRGFTLIELVVSIGLFSIIMLIALTVLFALVAANKNARNIQIAADNAGFVMEDIIRGLRFGYNYHCDVNVGKIEEPRDCSGGADSIAFENGFDKNKVIYRYNETSGVGIIEKIDNGNSPVRITPESVNVQKFQVYVTGSSRGGDDGQARVRIVLDVLVADGQQETSMILQSSVSQRFID